MKILLIKYYINKNIYIIEIKIFNIKINLLLITMLQFYNILFTVLLIIIY